MRRSGAVPGRGGMILVILLLMVGTSSVPLQGQEGGFAFQLRGGRFLPTGTLKDADGGWEGETGGGVAFGMGFTFPLVGPLGTYFGFGQYRFSCQRGVCPQGEKWETTGFDVALRYVVNRTRALRPWIQLGLHTHRLRSELMEAGGSQEVHSDGGGGAEVGGGLLIQVGERTSLSPGIRYGHGTVPYPGRPSVDLRYVVLDLGLVVGF